MCRLYFVYALSHSIPQFCFGFVDYSENERNRRSRRCQDFNYTVTRGGVFFSIHSPRIRNGCRKSKGVLFSCVLRTNLMVLVGRNNFESNESIDLIF
jgi:hypothetical protein